MEHYNDLIFLNLTVQISNNKNLNEEVSINQVSVTRVG